MKKQAEKLSILLDDDAEADINAELNEVLTDVNLQYRMRRYQIIGATLRNELPQTVDTDFHHRVMAKIRAELPTAEMRDSGSETTRASAIPLMARSWFKPFAGLTVAASVALVTVALWQPLQQGPGQNDGLASADQQKIEQLAGQQIAGSAVPASGRVRSAGTRWKLEHESPVLQRKLNAYLVNHTEYSNSMQGLIPQARVAGFDAQQ
ncbi:RseA family anti-sigma factor [Gammaproteobacteria bacterium]|nr:RseA family anti-sigma factor [Gammaproteobacteria bacterium]